MPVVLEVAEHGKAVMIETVVEATGAIKLGKRKRASDPLHMFARLTAEEARTLAGMLEDMANVSDDH